MITGTAYILRTCAADMTSYGGFVWPREGRVEAPDWRANDECGRGLHGFLWGEGDGSIASWEADAVWIVARIERWVDLRGKVKFPSADVVFAGDRIGATAAIRAFGAHGAVVGSTLTGGYRSTLTGGYGSTLTGGDDSTLVCRWWDGEESRYRLAVGECGHGLDAGVPYRVVSGKFERAA